MCDVGKISTSLLRPQPEIEVHEIGSHVTVDARGMHEVMTLTSTLRHAHDKASQAFPVFRVFIRAKPGDEASKTP